MTMARRRQGATRNPEMVLGAFVRQWEWLSPAGRN